ncbi:MAG: hypothetical protein IPN84_06875 [Sphingomonadales bacterium]|nr:hypothetical protein [Sphingomonadales bacterium]
MTPGASQHLISVATTLGGRVIAALPEDSYAVGDTKMSALVCVLMAQHVDGAADLLIRENAAIRAIFSRAAPLVGGDLGARLAEAGATTDANFRISTLEAGNAALATLLIELQTALETRNEDWAKELDRDSWRVLRDGANGRMLQLPPA